VNEARRLLKLKLAAQTETASATVAK